MNNKSLIKKQPALLLLDQCILKNEINSINPTYLGQSKIKTILTSKRNFNFIVTTPVHEGMVRFYKRFANKAVGESLMSGNSKLYSINSSKINKFGLSDVIKVTGYSRKMWYKNKFDKKIKFKIGQSRPVLIQIPHQIKIKLVNKRKALIFSSNKRLINKFVNTVYILRPADDYKGEGIQVGSKIMRMKSKIMSK